MPVQHCGLLDSSNELSRASDAHTKPVVLTSVENDTSINARRHLLFGRWEYRSVQQNHAPIQQQILQQLEWGQSTNREQLYAVTDLVEAGPVGCDSHCPPQLLLEAWQLGRRLSRSLEHPVAANKRPADQAGCAAIFLAVDDAPTRLKHEQNSTRQGGEFTFRNSLRQCQYIP